MQLVLQAHLLVEVAKLSVVATLHGLDFQQKEVLLLFELLQVQLSLGIPFASVLLLLGC